MGLSLAGREASTTIAGGVRQMWEQGEKITAALIAIFAVIAPALQIGFLLAILLSVRRPPAPRWVGKLLRWAEIARDWSMVEVMMLGILVSLVKIAAIARVVPGVGIFAAGGLILLLAAMSLELRPARGLVAGPLGERRLAAAAAPFLRPGRGGGGAMSAVARTGMREGFVSCDACGLLSRPAGAEEPGECPRCGEELEFRRRNAIQRTWALVIAAAICYLPANILPVMRTTTLTSEQTDTIISGVVRLYATGSWYLALILLIASVMIPLAKLAALAYLLITVQRGSVAEQPGAGAAVSRHGGHRAMVDGRRVRRDVRRRPHPAPAAHVRRATARGPVLLGGGRPDDHRRGIVRPPPDLGFQPRKAGDR